MDEELSDLIPLFLSESRGRLERLMELMARLEGDEEVEVEARRQLHTLKGSCRLLDLSDMAELCRQGEEILDAAPPQGTALLLELLERFERLLDAAGRRWNGPAGVHGS